MVDPAFGHWLAGFTDGEGSFGIFSKDAKVTTYYRCLFAIQLRLDDRVILEEIQRQLGVGCVYSFARRHDKSTPNRKPQARLQVTTKEGCTVVRDTFRAYPLRAKKARDFEIWCRALDHWLVHPTGGSWGPMIAAKAELEAVRIYALT